jgi:hypothetical protein
VTSDGGSGPRETDEGGGDSGSGGDSGDSGGDSGGRSSCQVELDEGNPWLPGQGGVLEVGESDGGGARLSCR